MKKVRTFKSKLIMFMLAIVFPLSATGAVLSLTDGLSAKATDSASTKYSSGTIQSMTLTNGNFSSSSSTGLISSPSGWSAQQNSSKATAGVINVGNSFQSNMDTYRLANNPGKKGSDKHILMINSKTATSSNNYSASQDYKSNSVTLDANSYYSFQVSFKNDTNYNSYTAYDVEKGSIQEASGYEIDASTFTVEGKDFDSHIAFTYYSSSTTYKNVYLKKSLTESGKISTIIENVEKFYEDGTYFGFMHEGTPIYVSKQYAKEYGSGNEKTYNIEPEGEITTYTCDITYNPTTKKYTVPQGTKFYGSRTAYTSLNDHTFGSIYLDGLTDENGKTIGFTEVSSKEWQTFYFFVATGDESKSVSFDLFLGSQDRGSSGVVFFDDARINKYSENEFWKTYQNYYGKSYTQETVSGEDVKTYDCTKFVNLKKSSSAIEEFGFEVGDGSESLENWEVTGTGHAQVFDTKAAQYFKSVTTYDYVGSDLSCKVTLDGEEIDLLEENKNVLALWAKDGNVQVKSKNIDVLANEIYKITAKYKVSNIESGSAYLLVSENGSLVNGERYNLSSYTLASETASSAISSNADNNFINDYGTVEFFVKGGAHYDSSINFSLALGKNGETATGCVLFDNITIEKATTDEYTNATNKLALDEKTGTQNITNGNFRSTTITEDNTYPYAPEGWTVSGAASNVWAYAGVINTETTQYNRFASLYNEMAESGIADRENPYFWAVYANPTASNGTAEAQNIMMLSNIDSTAQTLKSSNFALTANTTYKLSFDFKTLGIVPGAENNTNINVVIKGEDGFELYRANGLSTSGSWQKDYEIYIKTLEKGATNAYIEIEFGTSTTPVRGFAYFDNFYLTSTTEAIPSNKSVVDMTNYYLNLPTNNIPDDLSSLNSANTPAFKGEKTSGNNDITGGIVKSDAFEETNHFHIAKASDNDESKNVFYIQSQGSGSYTLTSKFNFDLEAEKYYTLSFKLKTKFNDSNLDTDKEYTYGATVGLTGFDYMSEIKSNDEYQEYKIYISPSEATSSQLYIALVCDEDLMGAVAIYDIALADDLTEDEYNSAKESDEDEELIFVAQKSDAEDDGEGESDPEEETPTSEGQGFDWLLVPTLITALAIVIAIVGYFMRKIKIKKIEVKRKESYDRKTSLNVDAIKLKAAKERTAEVSEVQSSLDKFQKELENLEAAHKQKVVELRAKDKGKVSKETDREFKQFAQKRTVISEKIDNLKKQIEELNSPEHLLSLERKIYAQEEMKQRELAKISKQKNKEMDKAKEEAEKKSDKSSNKKSKK